MAWKRGEIAAEVEAAQRAVAVMGGGVVRSEPAGLPELASHVLVVVRKLGRTPATFPRDPAARRRRPW